ncbi:MAG: hypothetical protein DCF28_06685 [Alphaproteobacteria bacterium]|nr:MAG: hypothetical protein DCF28_06685 [Alphaproteobacteria bacterium]PZO39887.1 MAG: hypothetical protein DCE92_03570 [Alphaproteobacteria bacterium]
MTRTSQTHPLQIAEIAVGRNMGKIGVTFCPGKKQPSAATGAWDRDLDIDLGSIAGWGAAAVVSLIEDHEIQSLKVQGLGQAVRVRHMDWLHLPIRDVSVPDERFEAAWVTAGESLRDRLRSGFNILIHCKGGLGRAGMIAARLLVELDVPAEEAIARVRRARPGAIETSGQEAFVWAIQPVPEHQPDTSIEAIEDRAVGAFWGLAMGDAVGTTLEFAARDTKPLLTNMIGGGPFRLKPGEWTDDTAMAMALADSLASCGELDEQDLLRRFSDWWRNGTYSCTGTCFDIGATTAQAIGRWEQTKADNCGATDPHSAGNGSLMRLAPVPIRFWQDRSKLRDAAARQSKTTHAAPEAVDACVVYADMIADAIEGKPRSAVLAARTGEWAGAIVGINGGSWRGKQRADINASGYVAHAMEASLWAVGRCPDFERAVLLAANLGQDADTTAAITGQLAGALAGAASLPKAWSDRLALRPRIHCMASDLFRSQIAADRTNLNR